MSCNCNRGWQGAVPVAESAAPLPATPYQRRMAVCAGCDELQRLHGGLPKGADVGLLDRCGACGCFVKAKAALPGQQCPLGKWELSDE